MTRKVCGFSPSDVSCLNMFVVMCPGLAPGASKHCPPSQRARALKITFISLICVGIALYCTMDEIMFYKFYGHRFGTRSYSSYDRIQYTDSVFGAGVHFNRSLCKYKHVPTTFMDDTNILNFVSDSKNSNQGSSDLMRVHVWRYHSQDQLEWVWHSILQSPQQRFIGKDTKELPEYGIQLVRLESLEDLIDRKDCVENLFVIAQSWELDQVASSLEGILPRSVPIGLLLLGEEACVTNPLAHYLPTLSGVSSSTSGNTRRAEFQFAFTTYGDCDVVDGRRVHLWPLGPSLNYLAALDSNTLPPASKPMSDRHTDMNLLVSLREEKRSRPQAMISFRAICERWDLTCVERTGLTLYSLLGDIGSLFGDKYHHKVQHWFAQNLPVEYMNIMYNSKITLSPVGTAPETYRIIEAMMAGSVPVVEDWADEGASPLMGPHFKCLAKDNMAFLKDNDAPVFWVNDWGKDLPRVLEELRDPALLQARQDAMLEWYERLLVHLRTIWIKQARTYFKGPTPVDRAQRPEPE